MTVFKKIFKVGIIVLGIFLFFKIVGVLFFKSNKDRQAELIDFRPTESLKIRTSKPIYYYTENELYYSNNGEIDLSKSIWKGKIELNKGISFSVSVSPNSEYIAFNTKNKIIILNYKGKEITRISLVSKYMFEERKQGNFWATDFQWSKNSKNLYLMKDMVWKGIHSSEQNKSSVYKFSIKTKELIKLIDLDEQSHNYYINSSENNLYYTSSNKEGNWEFKKVDLKTKKVVDTLKRNENLYLKTNDSIFVNYKLQIGHPLNFQKGITTQRKDSLCNTILIENDIEKLIFKGKCGFNAFKNWSYSYLSKKNQWFLPNDNFYLSFIDSKNYNGTIIIDTENLNYKFYDKKIIPFYSFTNNDKKEFIYTSGELIPSYKNDK